MKKSHESEILFVHGLGCHGAVWRRFLDHMEARGGQCLAPTLLADHRPGNPVKPPPPHIGFETYVSEVRALCKLSIQRTGRRPIVIGHSMGGLIAQIVAAEGLCRKAVFLAPAPPKGVVNHSPWMLWCFANVLMSGATQQYHKGWRLGVQSVLLHRLPRDRRDHVYSKMVFEPGQLFVDMAGGIEVPTAGFIVPTLCIAAGRDRAVPAGVVRRIAKRYSNGPVPTEFRLYRDHGHWLLDEPGSACLYSDISAWIEAPAHSLQQVTRVSGAAS